MRCPTNGLPVELGGSVTICMILSFLASVIMHATRRSSLLACEPLLDRQCEHQCSNDSYDSCCYKRSLRRELPQQASDCRRGRDRQASNQIIESDGSRSQMRLREIHNHRFA